MLSKEIKKEVHYYLDIIGLYNSKNRNDSNNAKSILNYFGNSSGSSSYCFEACLKENHSERYKLMIFDTKPLPHKKEDNYGTLTLSKSEYLTFITYLKIKTNTRNNILDVE